MVSLGNDKGKRVYRLVHGKVLDNGKVIVKKSIWDAMVEELGIQRGDNVHY
tara:strand:+ start:382 stop:534 length:153 start_codon:yes stop_codon:yes gene_type:complete